MTGASAQHYRSVRPRRRRAGASLIELIASTAIIGILAVALGSTMILSARANEQAVQLAETPNNQGIVKQIASDLQLATAFTQRTDTAVTFTVPDRDGDNIPETISYAWSGTAGDPLVYRYNNSSVVTIADDVHGFALSYLLRTTQGIPQGPQEQESAEMLLIFHDNAPKGSFHSYGFSASRLAGQYFSPTLPINTVSWKITRASVRAQRSNAADIVVQIRPADPAMKPTQQVLEEVSFPVGGLPWSYLWIDANFSSLSGLDPSDAFCVVVTSNTGSYSGGAQYEQRGKPMTPNTHWTTSEDGGNSWSTPDNDKDMRFKVWGTVTTLGAPQWP